MIELFTACDEGYGKRVAEALRQADNLTEKGPIGTAHSKEAVEQAIEHSKEAKPY